MLPPLPKKNRKLELDFNTVFRQYVEKHGLKYEAQYELKDTRGKNYFYIKELDEKQINHALRAKTPKGNLVRIINGTPGAADFVYYKNCQYSFIVIRYPRFLAFIDIDDLLNEKTKSITSTRAKEIATFLSPGN